MVRWPGVRYLGLNGRPRKQLFLWRGSSITIDELKSAVVGCIFSLHYHGSSFFAHLSPKMDIYDSHINSWTIDLYLVGKIPKFNFRLDNKREFQFILLCPLENLPFVSMRNPGIF